MKLLITVFLISLCAACSGLDKYSNLKDNINWAEADAKLLPCTEVPDTLIQNRANEMNAFGSRLMAELQKKSPESNQLISPLSIQSAFALLYPATNGNDGTEISNTLGFGQKDGFYWSMRGLLGHYSSLNKKYKSLKLENYNNVWSSQALNLQPEYLVTIKQQFDAKIALMDFVESEKSRIQINDFIAKKTNKLIKDLLPEGSIDGNTTTVLTNALYLKSPFINPFSKESTVPKIFKTPDSDVSIPFMSREGGYHSNLALDTYDYDAISLPMHGDISMMFIKTRTDNWRNLNKLVADQDFWKQGWPSLLDQLQHQRVALSIPKFQLSAKTSLAENLKSLGLSQVFDPSADNFQKLYDEKMELFISDVVHATVLKVDEIGAEAAAATSITIGTTSAPGPAEFSFIADEPCLVVIYDEKYGSVLFLGLLADPG